MPTITISIGPKLFEFTHFGQWVNKATMLFAQHGANSINAIAIDAKGRICSTGKDFRIAKETDAFPVSVFFKSPASEQAPMAATPVTLGPVPGQCSCLRCLRERDVPGQIPAEMGQMILCSVCGNKRCPHSDDHNNPCTGSNEPGQPGSRY